MQGAGLVIGSAGGNYLTALLQRFGFFRPQGNVQHDVMLLLFLVGVLALASIVAPYVSEVARAHRREAALARVRNVPPAPDAFICASVEDEAAAGAVCSALERDGLRCWIRSRDLDAGGILGEQLGEAMSLSGTVLLLFTKHANNDHRVLGDLEYAFEHDVPILPLRLDDTKPATAIKYCTAGRVWFDAVGGPLDSRLASLVPHVRRLLEGRARATGAPADAPAPAASPASITAPAAQPTTGNTGMYTHPEVPAPAQNKARQKVGLLRTLASAWYSARGMITSERQLEDVLQLPVLAATPRMTTVDPYEHPILAAALGRPAHRDPKTIRDAAMEAYFQLVLAMRYTSEHPLRSITIASPSRGDGRSTVALNVAGAFGEIAITSEGDRRVLIIDADMRRPALHQRLDVSNERGLSDVLKGRKSFLEAVQRTDRPGVDVLTSGTPIPNPVKWLQTGRFDALLQDVKYRYACVVVDTPALTRAFDGAIAASQTDATVLVVGSHRTTFGSVRKALARLAIIGQNDVLGAVFNFSNVVVPDYSEYFAPVRRQTAP